MAVTVTSITPNIGAQGGHLFHVVIHGTGFVAGAVVTFSGANVAPEAATTVIDSATQIHLNVVINGGAAIGRRTVTVTNLDASTGSLALAFTVTLLSFTAYQPYNHLPGLARNCLLYDPRGDVAPFLYSIGGAPNNAGVSSHVWALNRRTGVITDHTGQFHNWPSFGPADMDEFGVLWWIGIEAGNLTQSKEAQTAFAADTLTKIGSVTTNGVTILYPSAGQVRVDRHSPNHFVWALDQADDHSIHGNLHCWDRETRVRVYNKTAASWDGVPVGGTRNRVWDIDSDSAGNLW